MPPGRLTGRVTDYGDLIHVEQWRLKGQHLLWAWHIGPPRDTTPADRIPTGTTPVAPHNGRIDLIMDLQADKQVTLSGSYTDEIGNPVDPPAGAVVTYTVDDALIVALTDLGDGTAVAAATGVLGVANVHAEATFDGRTATGDIQIVVVAGLAERFTIAASDPTEVTPDV
jgi:hypothetical protein